MKFIYPAVFHQTKNGSYEGYFPDLEDCRAKGDTLEEAVLNANEAALDWIRAELEDENGSLPSVSDPRDLKPEEGGIVRNICVNIRFYEGWDE